MPQLAAQTRLVIFDCDGVLVDSELIANAVMAEALSVQGWSMSAEESVARFKGGHMHQVHDALEAHLGRTASRDWITDFDQACLDTLTQVKAIDGILDLVKRVQSAGLGICVASQGPHEKMAVTLKAAGLAHKFTDRIFSSRDVARPKPAPNLFLHAAQSCGVAPEDCAVIEDSVTGVAAARAAGMTVFYLNAEGESLEGATTILHPSELNVLGA